jgi:hypothetical protein
MEGRVYMVAVTVNLPSLVESQYEKCRRAGVRGQLQYRRDLIRSTRTSRYPPTSVSTISAFKRLGGTRCRGLLYAPL